MLLLHVACGGSGSSAGSSTPAASAPAPASTEPTKVNLDEIFPPGRGREVVLNNCTNCHTIVPIVVLQKDRASWEESAKDHRDRTPELSDADRQTLYDYLIANFNPDKPVPKLPKELLDTWTSY